MEESPLAGWLACCYFLFSRQSGDFFLVVCTPRANIDDDVEPGRTDGRTYVASGGSAGRHGASQSVSRVHIDFFNRQHQTDTTRARRCPCRVCTVAVPYVIVSVFTLAASLIAVVYALG